MSVYLSFRPFTSGQPDVRSSLPLPMVYESVPAAPTVWEYRVLTIDTSERALPDAAHLNEYGQEGWLLAGMLDERNRGSGMFVHYYFVRQKAE
jgi:hypothetical protein